jgi:uncharacterized membrane protein
MSEMPPPNAPPPYNPPPPPPGGGSYLPPPPPPGGPGAPGSDRSMMLVLSYLWFLCLIPLTQKKDDAEIQWHAKNGLVMAIVVTGVDLAFMIFSWFFPVSAFLLSCVPCVIGIGYLIVTIMCIMKALAGQRFRVPVLTDYAEKI